MSEFFHTTMFVSSRVMHVHKQILIVPLPNTFMIVPTEQYPP